MVRSGCKLACAMTDMIIDMDSTIQGVYGRQEGAQKGYNPHKKDSWHITPCWRSVPKPRKSCIAGTVAAALIPVTAPLNL